MIVSKGRGPTDDLFSSTFLVGFDLPFSEMSLFKFWGHIHDYRVLILSV